MLALDYLHPQLGPLQTPLACALMAGYVAVLMALAPRCRDCRDRLMAAGRLDRRVCEVRSALARQIAPVERPPASPVRV